MCATSSAVGQKPAMTGGISTRAARSSKVQVPRGQERSYFSEFQYRNTLGNPRRIGVILFTVRGMLKAALSASGNNMLRHDAASSMPLVAQ